MKLEDFDSFVACGGQLDEVSLISEPGTTLVCKRVWHATLHGYLGESACPTGAIENVEGMVAKHRARIEEKMLKEIE